MAFNYGPPAGAFGRQPAYAAPGSSNGAPAMPPMGFSGAPPPGVMSGAPGIPPQHSPAGFPGPFQGGQFQPPPNMPDINFNAPVIRLGLGEQRQERGGMMDRIAGSGRDGRGSNSEPLGGGRSRLGLGADRRGGDGRDVDRERAAVRESMMALQPPTREEVARTIFIGGLSEGTPSDDAIETILRCPGKLRRWTRAVDAEGRLCKFGFAEYEDVESLEAANEILHNIEVPLLKNGAILKNDEGEIQKTKLLVVVDDASKSYIEEWMSRRKETEENRLFRMDSSREDLSQCLAAISNAVGFSTNGFANSDGVAAQGNSIGDGQNGAEVVTIPLSLEDELSDIPSDMRATVAAEIKAFRDRSTLRDRERQQREEAMEQAERNRTDPSAHRSRLASDPPSGPVSSSNGIPVGPRGGVQGAPSGPRGFRGTQMPNDYVNGVPFISANGTANGVIINREDDDAEESDEELYRRRKEKRDAELDKTYTEVCRRVQNREQQRELAKQRMKTQDADKQRVEDERAEKLSRREREFNDEEEARLKRELYYKDRMSWLRNRNHERNREEAGDARDRDNEERTKAEARNRTVNAHDMANAFLADTERAISQKGSTQNQPPTGFKISLGANASAAQANARADLSSQPGRRVMGDIEGLLDDEDAANASISARPKPALKPLTDTSTVPIDLTDQERLEGQQQLASEIPNSKDELFNYSIKWNYLTPSLLTDRIRPFVEKKVVDYLGVAEEVIVEATMDALSQGKSGMSPVDLVSLLDDAMGEEAEPLVKKVWRMAIFYSEAEARGFGGL
nr:u1 snrnp-associated protein [Quercus suber]